MASLCGLVWNAVLQNTWSSDTRLVTGNPNQEEIAPVTPSPLERVRSIPNVSSSLLAEEFIALVYLNFIHRVLVRIRWLIIAATLVYVLLLISVKSYPFQPRAATSAFFILLFIGIGAVVTTIYAQMHRDATLSHLTNTEPGELGTDFWIRMLAFGSVPIFTIVTTQVPGLSRFFFLWLKPMVDALHK